MDVFNNSIKNKNTKKFIIDRLKNYTKFHLEKLSIYAQIQEKK